jgi:uncharacterized protein YvpB
MLSDWQDIGGQRYYLGGAEDGSMKSGWQKLGGSWYYLGAAEDGALKTGWQKLGNLWYYLNPGDGIMLSDWQDIGGQRYYLGGAEDGSMKTGWYQIGSGWYNFASDGHCVNPENPQTSPGTRLDVPLLLQMPDYPTGCEAASVAMMLRYAGHDVSVADVVRIMPYHSSNPNLGFVGNPRTWSGVTIYPPALLNVVRAYTGSAVDLTGASLDTFKNYLDTGRPVVCWIQESSGLHCVAITGYDLQNFYYNDPYGGKDKAVSYARLTTMRAALGNRALSY